MMQCAGARCGLHRLQVGRLAGCRVPAREQLLADLAVACVVFIEGGVCVGEGLAQPCEGPVGVVPVEPVVIDRDGVREVVYLMGWDGMGWDGMGWDGMGCAR
jgi:hypothetical protein